MLTRGLATALAAGLTTFVCLGSATAQMPGLPERHLIRIGFGGGVSVPTSHAADLLKNGINGQAFVLVDTGVLPPLRFNLGYQKFDFKEAVLGQAITGESQMLSGMAGMTVNLLKLGPIRPYVTGGLGAFSLKEEIGDSSESSVRFGIDGGGGIALKLGRLEAFVEGRIQNVYTDQGAIDTSSIRAIPVTFGIMF